MVWAFIWIVAAVLWASGLLLLGALRWVVWALALLVTAFAASGVWHHRREPWRRIYFPLMQAWAAIAAAHKAAERAGIPHNMEAALQALVRERYPGWSDTERVSFVEANRARYEQGVYRQRWTQVAASVFGATPPHDPEKERALWEDAANATAFRVWSIITDMIDRECGSAQSDRMWMAILRREVA